MNAGRATAATSPTPTENPSMRTPRGRRPRAAQERGAHGTWMKVIIPPGEENGYASSVATVPFVRWSWRL